MNGPDGAEETGPEAVAAAVARLRQQPISATEKGFGPVAAGRTVTAAGLARERPAVFGGGFTMPLLVLRDTALGADIAAMAAYCAAAGVEIAPHGKTTMAPQIVARQLAAGAWGVTAATIGQVQVFRSFGVPRILLANELTDPAGIAWLAGERAADPGFECYVYVDSAAGVALLDRLLPAGARPLPVLVELGQPGGRTGCRSAADAMAVARAAAAASSLRLAGVAGYEGNLGGDGSPATLEAVGRYCAGLRRLAGLAAGLAGPGPFIVSAGGSAYFDVVVRELTRPGGGRAPTVVLRSGCYVAHDDGFYSSVTPSGRGDRAAPQFTAALELWAHVLSRPEPGLALACAGRRDVSFDKGMPVPLRVRSAAGQVTGAAGMRVTRLDDQHAYVSVPPASALAPGDLVCFGISHPCTTFDKWRVIPVVDEGYRVIDAVRTFF